MYSGQKVDLNRNTFSVLNGIRGIAALIVVLWHENLLLGVWRPASGYLAVDQFFVLSGFVLANAYGRRLSHTMSSLTFVRMRFIRLYPVYIIGTGVSVIGISVALILGIGVNWSVSYLLYILLFAGFMMPAPSYGLQGPLFPLNVPSWSLFYELLINVVFAFAWRYLSSRVLAAMLMGTGSLVVYIATFGYGLNQGAEWDGGFAALCRVSFSFFIGVALCRYKPKILLPSWVSLICLVALSTLLCIGTPGSFRPAYDVSCIVIFFPAFMLLATCSSVDKMTGRLCDALGSISYPMYTIHVPLFAIVGSTCQKIFAANPSRTIGTAWISFAILIATAWMINEWVDPLARQWLKRIVRHEGVSRPQ